MSIMDQLMGNNCDGYYGDHLHVQDCCIKAHPMKGEGAPTVHNGFTAYFVPSVADHTWTGEAGSAYPTGTGQVDVSGKWYPAKHTPVSTAGYTVQVIEAADTEHVRVTQMVRDFGFLPSNRAIKFATSIGMDWDGFGIQVVGDEDEYPVVPVDGLPMNVKRHNRPKAIEDIKGWRRERGMRHQIAPDVINAWIQ